MIKINIVAVGKIKEKYYVQAIEEYKKRLTRFCEIRVIEIKDENFTNEPNPNEILQILNKESINIEKELKGKVVSLAIEGERLDSLQFSNFLTATYDRFGEITFVIGGSYGIDKKIKEKSFKLISMSEMTFPHTLARVLLIEQIYRSFMINSGSNYHK